jgi:sugar phosphate isomerase/epimerase
MAKGKKGAARQMRTVELDAVRGDAKAIGESGFEFNAASRLVRSVPKLLDEIDRLKAAVADRDERLARIAGATKRPVNKRGPRKKKEEPDARVPDSTDPAQTSIVDAGASTAPLE